MLDFLDRALSRLEEILISLLLITSSALLFVNVVARYVFSTGLVWAEEFVRYEIVWMVFVGGSVAARKGIHIGVDAFVRLLPQAARRAVSIGAHAICVAFCLVLVVHGTELVMQTQEFGQRTPAMQAPFWAIQVAIPLGAGLMALRFCQQILREIRGVEERAEFQIIN